MTHFHAGDRQAAEELVMRFHYSHRIPSNVQFVATMHTDGGLFGDDGEAVAAVMFSIPPTRWSEPVLELSRLVRAEGVELPLTMLIGKACDCLRRHGWDLLVSFADKTHKHHGGIYQAASWNYAGARDKRLDGAIVDGVFVSGRTLNHQYGTQSPTKLLERTASVVEPHYDEGKHLYWRALNKDGRKKAVRLGLQSLPYPKPGLLT